MLTVSEIKKYKEEYHYTNEHLSKLSGVPLGTVQKIMGSTTRSPRFETLKALSDVFEKKEGGGLQHEYASDESIKNADMLKEAGFAYNAGRTYVPENTNYYPRQGTYTIDDYLALPDDQRVELIDGVIYDMDAPTIPHQLIGGDIYSRILMYVREKGGKCMSFIAPTDVQLDCDNRTMVQPDVMIICDRSKINRKRIFGAPDFALEVLSPSTKRKDIFIKSEKYCNAGVREYWLVDPMNETVMTFDFENDISMKMYTFEDKVPVKIYDGDCIIDFKEIKAYYAFLDENEGESD